MKHFHFSELFVSNREKADVPLGRKNILNALLLGVGRFLGSKMVHVDRKLCSHKTHFFDALAELCVCLSLSAGECWEVKKNKHPHDSIG